jgi:hypothetical protein
MTTSSGLEVMASVADSYVHVPKIVTPGEDLVMPKAHLKWYDIAPAGEDVPAETRQQARAFLRAQPAADAEGVELGFVILHRCGESFYFLMLCTWRNNNELWQTVFSQDDRTRPDFPLVPREQAHKPTYCVWELGPVLHEQQAWLSYLRSSRDDADRASWLSDRFSGTV